MHIQPRATSAPPKPTGRPARTITIDEWEAQQNDRARDHGLVAAGRGAAISLAGSLLARVTHPVVSVGAGAVAGFMLGRRDTRYCDHTGIAMLTPVLRGALGGLQAGLGGCATGLVSGALTAGAVGGVSGLATYSLYRV